MQRVDWVEQVSDDEMIATFLRAEVDSKRFGGTVRALLQRLGGSVPMLQAPDVASAQQNRIRRLLLAEFRGYGRGSLLFRGFPSEVVWWRARLDLDDLLSTRFCSFPDWVQLSGETRRVADGASAVLAGDSSKDAALIREIVIALKNGEVPAPLIFVTTSTTEPLVALEGHKRLTAYAILRESAPDGFDACVGVSVGMGGWAFF